MLAFKLVSSLEKAFLDEKIQDFEDYRYISGLRGERISFQLLGQYQPDERDLWAVLFTVKFEGNLAKYAKIRNVRHMAVTKPSPYGFHPQEGYLRTTPGVFPDLLEEAIFGGKFVLSRDDLQSFWIDVEIPDSDEVVGKGTLSVTVEATNRTCDLKLHVPAMDITVEVINATLPEQEMKMTHWFYCDTLAQYYNLPVWSEEHWQIVERFAALAVKHGQNMILTPIFTPTLDTYVGGERLTNQLVGITKSGDSYSFDFSLLDRWIAMCDRIGMKYLEIAHLFTQWGATHAPKIMATVDGEYRKLFGWETDAHSKEYGSFLRTLLTEMLAHLKKSGNDTRCFFHISDEPHENQLEDYKKSQDQVKDVLRGYTVMDALSSFEFYKKGVTETPIPHTRNAHAFVDANTKDLWVYYCGAAGNGCSSRMLAMPAARNRALGMQLFKYNIVGFLHWGYNFYNTCHSYSDINPFSDQSGEDWVPAGDMFLVYPGKDGKPMESTRYLVFDDGLKDMRAMKLCASLYSHEEVVKAIEEVAGINIMFTNTICDGKTVLAIREKVNAMIKAKV